MDTSIFSRITPKQSSEEIMAEFKKLMEFESQASGRVKS